MGTEVVDSAPAEQTAYPARAALSLAPFAGAACLTWIAVVVGNQIDWPVYAIATVLLVLTGVLPFAGPRDWRLGGVPAALTFLASVALLRSAAGGISSGASGLAVIPVFYTALYGSRRELATVIVATAVFYIAPIILIGGTAFPHSQYRAAVTSLAVSSIVGVATQGLVANVRREAHGARRREQMLEQVSDAVQRLFGSARPREDVCEAAMAIGGASAAALFEPVDGSATLRATATAGVDAPPGDVATDRHTAIGDAFSLRHAELVTENVKDRVSSLLFWEAARRPGCVLCEPLLRGSEPVGVLVVGWPDAAGAQGGRVEVVALLAHAAAAVLDRADRLSELEDRAERDPLTGLPNRRAWDSCVSTAANDDHRIIVAMLDLDHFKQFNDTYGHPAGDRLLKETAAAWREQVRSGDLLARLGGEEFGLLLLDCDTSQATEAIERIRKRSPEQRTCSAGFAVRAPGESIDQVTARADAALYQAKSSGRDRACMAAAAPAERREQIAD